MMSHLFFRRIDRFSVIVYPLYTQSACNYKSESERKNKRTFKNAFFNSIIHHVPVGEL